MKELEPTREKEIEYVNDCMTSYCRSELVRNFLVMELAAKMASVFDNVNICKFYTDYIFF